MPFPEPVKALSRLTRGANSRALREPVSIRALFATQSSKVRYYGTGKYMNSESATKSPDIPYAALDASRFGAPKSAGSSLTGAGEGKAAGGDGSREPQGLSEKAKIEEEDKEYQAEVERHNREFEKGYDHGHGMGSEPKVDEKFWKGYKERPFKHKA